MKILLTGASGFVGSHILERLCARRIATTVLLRPASSRRYLQADLPHVNIAAGALGDMRSLDSALQDVTHVIHCAGCTRALRLSEFRQVNQRGTRNVVEAINRRAGQIQRLIHISSLAAGGPANSDSPAREDAPPNPISEYGKSKLAGEEEVRCACKCAYVILRPPAVYGPRDTAFLALFRAIRAHVLPLFGNGNQPLSLVFVKDFAEAAVTCLGHAGAVGKTFYVAPSAVATVHGLAKEIAAQTKTWTVPVPLPMAVLWPLCFLQEVASRLTRRPNVLSLQKVAELRAAGWVCDAARLRQEVGFTCATGLREGIAETLAWYRQQGWMQT